MLVAGLTSYKLRNVIEFAALYADSFFFINLNLLCGDLQQLLLYINQGL